MTDENMQGTDAEGVDWGGTAVPEAAATWSPEDYSANSAPAASYPEYSSNPHNHRFTVSLSPGRDMPMMVVRAQTAHELTASFSEIESSGVWHNIGAAYASMRVGMNMGNGLGPATPVGPPAPSYGPPTPAPQAATPPPFGPNVSVPSAPNYQGPPPQQQWQQGPPANGGWSGNGGASQGAQTKPRPAGWAMVDVPFPDKDRFKALRAQGTQSGDYLRGKIQWGGKGTYWLDPSIAGYIAQQGFPVMQ